MIKFITGRSGSGKTYYCYDCIKQLVESKLANGKTAETKNNILLITPEQYNFTAEKHLLDILGEDKIIYVENSSFTQMYSEMIRKNGGGKTELSQGARVAIMKKAVKNKSESMQLFKKKTPHTSFIKSMLNLYDEVKACGIELNKINNTAQEFNDNNLHLKLSDIYLVFSEYEKLTDGPYLDSACKLEKLYKMLSDCMPDKDILTGRDVFIDGFNSFAENEYKIINQIFQKAHSVTITLGLDVSLLDEKYSLFSHVNAVYSKLKTLAMKSDGGYIEKNLDTNRRTAKDDLIFCEKNLFSSKKCTYDATPENIEIYSSKDIVDECDYVCLKISNLLRHSVNAKDIAVICRNKDKYLGTMLSTFKKYNIPYFDDERQAVDTQPLTVFIRYLMKSIYFRSDDILSLLKTGLTDLSIQNISLLENYIYVWNINGENKWSNQFEASPYGFKE